MRLILSDFVKIPQSFFCSKKNDSFLYKGAFDGQGRALSLRLCEIFNIVSTANRKAKSGYRKRAIAVERSETEGVKKDCFKLLKLPQSFFCEKMTAPSKLGRKHNSNLITTGSRHIFTNFLGGSKPPLYCIQYELRVRFSVKSVLILNFVVKIK